MTSIRLPTTDITDIGNQPGSGGPLRAGGQSMPKDGMMASTAKDLPSTLSPLAERQVDGLKLVRDLWEGTARVRGETQTYLPQAPGEDQGNYRIRLSRSVFFNVFAHSVEVLTGFVFRKDPVLGDDVPPQIVDLYENIDNAGTHGDVFLRDLLQDALTAGHAGILVEYPDTGGAQLSVKDEEPLRPYFVPIRKDDILSWRTATVDGEIELTQLVLRETSWVPDGAFGEVKQTLYRVLYKENGTVGWQLLAITPNRTVVQIAAGTYPTQEDIPFVEVPTSGRRSLLDSDPPLLDLAYLNVAHYQQWSDYATSIHKTNVPILFTSGFLMQDDQGNKIVVGPNSGLNSPAPDGKAMYVSHTGAALDSSKAALDDLKNEMAVLGVAMIATRKNAPETVEAKRIDRGSFDSALAVTARGLQDAAERAFDFLAHYLGLEGGGSIAINRDFENMTMQADMLTAWTAAVATAGVPERLMLTAMQDGGIIDPEEKIDALELEVMANKQAAADQATEQLKMTLAAKAKPAPGASNAVPTV